MALFPTLARMAAGPRRRPPTSADLAKVLDEANFRWFETALRRRLPDGDREAWKLRFMARAVSLTAYWRRRR